MELARLKLRENDIEGARSLLGEASANEPLDVSVLRGCCDRDASKWAPLIPHLRRVSTEIGAGNEASMRAHERLAVLVECCSSCAGDDQEDVVRALLDGAARCAASPSSRALLVVSDAFRRLFVSDMVACRGLPSTTQCLGQLPLRSACFFRCCLVGQPFSDSFCSLWSPPGRRAAAVSDFAPRSAISRPRQTRLTASCRLGTSFYAAGSRRVRQPSEGLVAGTPGNGSVP